MEAPHNTSAVASTQEAAPTYSLDDLTTPKQLVVEYPDILPMTRVRYLIREREHNGLLDSGALVKNGKHWFFVKPLLTQYLMTQRAA